MMSPSLVWCVQQCMGTMHVMCGLTNSRVVIFLVTVTCFWFYYSVQEYLGSGHFARVHRGAWRRPQGEVEVAVKELKCSSLEENKVKFLQEAVIMGQFNHTNVVKIYGVVTLDDPVSLSDTMNLHPHGSLCLLSSFIQPLIVMELMPNADLKNYLDKFSTKRYVF